MSPALRRGLPRVAGGDPWPPAGEAVDPWADAEVTRMAATAPADPAIPVTSMDAVAPASTGSGVDATVTLRRGLPRTPGGVPWPPVALTTTPSTSTPPAEMTLGAGSELPEPAPSVISASAPGAVTVALRRGLPRAAGADPWPPAGEALDRWAFVEQAAAEPATPEPTTPEPELAPGSTAGAPSSSDEMTRGAASEAIEAAPRVISAKDVAAVEPRKVFGLRIRTVVLSGIALVALAVIAVLAAQWFRAQPFGQDFIKTYPGETHLPEGAPVGFPAWLAWQHFFNVFFMVLIIRSGLQIRREKRPTAFWTPKWNAKRKISLAMWFHQSLDILWLANGVIFVILLVATGQWMRVVPTDWGVFPNAISAMIQYLSLDWPTENGWVNYNSLQVLAYFATIFIAAPLAAITGVRMSGIWPKKAVTLSKAYPLEWARAVHFPVMLYFCAFIVVHVALVFSTGMLRNLNHMYAGQDAVNWWGFAIFVVSLLVIAAGWIAARPLLLAGIARAFGRISDR